MKNDKRTKNIDKTADTLFEMIQILVAELHPHRLPVQIYLDSLLDRDLGLDSLARVELLARIERNYGVVLQERVFADAETPRDLLRGLLGASGQKAAHAVHEISKMALGKVETKPQEAQTLVDVLNWHVLTHPDRPHIQFYSDENKGEIITYGKLRKRALSVATGLQQQGLQPGEPVAIMLPTGSDYFFSFFGILFAGGVPVPFYPPVRRTHIEEHMRRHKVILANCKAATLITVPEARRFTHLLKSQVHTLRSVATVEELSSKQGEYTKPALGTQGIAFLQYTSGSTGSPKGVVLTHANLLANIRVMGKTVQVNAADVFISWLPLYHDMGLIGAWLSNLYHASLLVIMPPLAFIARPQRWLWAIHRHRGTLSAAPNFAYELCLRKLLERNLKGLDLSSWRAAFNGAEPVSPDTIQRFCERFSKYGFRTEALMPVYGLAECSVGLTFPRLGRCPVIDRIQRKPFIHSGRAVPASETDTRALRFVTCGQPLAGHQIRILDSAGNELPERQEGRLQFRGPSAASGYFRNPEETSRLFQEEWLNSGDLAYIVGGEVYITGRIKDIIIHAGRNIYPHELEEAIGNIPDIRQNCVAVFGSIQRESGTERLVVVAETRKDDPKVLDRLRSQINEISIDLLETPPDDVVLVPPHSIPKTSSGKIRRAASRELYESNSIGRPRRAMWWQISRLTLNGLIQHIQRARRLVSGILYAAHVWSLFILLAPIVWLSVVLLPVVSWRWTIMRAATRFLARASGVPFSVQGMEYLLPRHQPFILVCNHASYIDSFVLVAALPCEFSFVAKEELNRSFLSRLPLRRIRTEFVERFDKLKGIADAQRMASAARSGQSLLFYPEGTFTRMPGLLPFHMGAFVAAAEGKVPVIPLAIRGTRSILRAGSWIPRRGPITITVCKPVEPEEIKVQTLADPWKTALKLRNTVREQILLFSGEPDLAHEKSPI